MNIKYVCNEVGRTRKEEDEVGWWRLGRFIQFKQIFNKNNSSTLFLSRALHSHSCSIQRILPASARGMLSSLHSISVPLHDPRLLFIQSLHANYCNQTQVFHRCIFHAVEPLQGCMVQIESEFPSLEIIIEG